MPNPKLETYKNKATGTVYDLTDADAQSKVTATVDLLKDTTGWLGGNELENKLTSQTLSNVAVTVNDDKSIKLNGTPSADITSLFINAHINLKAGKYYLSGNPSGVTGNEYGLRISNADFSLNYFFEQGKVFELAQDTNDLRVDIRVPQGRQCDNELFYPMICKLATHEISPEYEPYHESVEDTINDVYKTNGVVGAKNLAYTEIEASLSGAPSEGYNLNYNSNSYSIIAKVNQNTNYIASKTSGLGNRFRIVLFQNVPSTTTSLATKEVVNNVNLSTFTFNSETYNYVVLTGNYADAYSGSINGMIRLATDTDPTYAPYAMTNRELTEKVQGIINAATNAADFAAFKTAIGNL